MPRSSTSIFGAPDDLDTLRDLLAARQEQLPILLLTIRVRPEDHAQMLGLGAGRFLSSNPSLLRSCRRASRRWFRPPAFHHADAVLQVDDLELSRLDHSVTRAGRKIVLTPKEFALLEYLMRMLAGMSRVRKSFSTSGILASDKMDQRRGRVHPTISAERSTLRQIVN